MAAIMPDIPLPPVSRLCTAEAVSARVFQHSRYRGLSSIRTWGAAGYVVRVGSLGN
jgi:hypothetical protein